nr:putative ribonuclease H-like domain-containing protein [Tanacetum cinerariifolium]
HENGTIPYFTDHVLWEVIVHGDLVSPVASAGAGVEGPIPLKTVKQKLARKNKLKAKNTLMLAIPDEHLLKFHACKDEKSLWETIKNRFGGNTESKKMQKTILKQNYENFAASSQEGLDKTYDSRKSNGDDNQVNDRFKKGEGYHAVPPPYTRNYMPPRVELSFAGLDNFVFKSKMSETITSVPKIETNASKTSKDSFEKPKTVRPSAPLIEEWESDSEDENVFKPKDVKKTVKPSLEKIEFVNATTVKNENKAEKLRKFSQSPRGKKRNWNGLMTRKLRDGFEFKKKACFVCGSINHLIKDYYFYENKMVLNNKGKITGPKEIKPVWDNTPWVNHQNKLTHPHPKRKFIPAAVLTKSGQVPVNDAKQSSQRAATSVSAARRVNTAASRPNVNNALPTTYSYFKAHSLGNSQYALQAHRIFDSGCSRHITRNKSYLTDYQEIDCGFVAFGENAKEGKITRKGKIRTGKLDFEDVYYMKELKFNLFSVSQMYDKKNSVLFTDTECVVLSPDFKLLDESQVLLKNYDKFYEMKGIRRDFSVARTPQQNGVAKRKNKTLIEVARTMLTDSKLPTTILAEAVNTACYVQNKMLVIKSHNKTPYELFPDRQHALSFMRPFGCPVTILNTLNHLGPKSLENKVADDAGKKMLLDPLMLIPINAATLLNAGLLTDPLMPDLEDTADRQDTRIFSGEYDDKVEGVVADFNNLELTTVEVHVCQLPGFEDPHFPNKVEKALYDLHQAPRAWYETFSTYLLENRFRRGIIDKTLFIKKDKDDLLLVQVYVDDIIFRSTKKSLCIEFEGLMHEKFQMSSMGELNFFLGL